jgi:hypothetical protein
MYESIFDSRLDSILGKTGSKNKKLVNTNEHPFQLSDGRD